MLFELYYVVQLFFVWSACSLVALFRRVILGRTDNGLAELKQKWKQQLQTKYGCHVATPSELSNEPIKAENCMIGQLGDTDIFVKFVTTEQSALWWHYVMCLGYCREVRLYEFLNPYGEFAIPRLFDSKLDRWSGNYYVALSKVKNAVVRPDAEFRTFPDYIAAAKRCLTEIGKIHKHFRGKTLPHWLLAQSNSSPIDGIAIYKSCFQPIVLQAYEAVKTFINREPATLIHGDFRPGNILIGNAISSSSTSTSTSSSGSVTIVDWFHPMRGHGLYDYVYFCCLSGNIHSEDTWQHYCNASGLNAKDPYQLEVLLVTAIEFILLCHFYFRTGIDKVFKNPDKDKNYWVDILEKYKQQIFSKKHEWSKLLKFNEIQTEQLIKELNRA